MGTVFGVLWGCVLIYCVGTFISWDVMWFTAIPEWSPLHRTGLVFVVGWVLYVSGIIGDVVSR